MSSPWQEQAISWNDAEISTLRSSGRQSAWIRLASFTAGPTTVKSSRSLAPILP